MFKKSFIPIWIMLLALAAATFSCNKHDDDDDDWGGNGGGGNIWNPTIIDGKLPGLFSVSQNQQVQFSQGNLQYQASTNTWRFAEHQWDYVGSPQNEYVGGTVTGSDNSAISQTYNGWIDLFGWGTSGYNHGAVCYQPYSTSNTNSDYYVYGNRESNLYDSNGQADWGYNAISNGGNRENYWRTLTKEEWRYLFETRTTSSGLRFAKARVNDVGGIILLPDDWNVSVYSLNNPNDATSESYFSDNIISASQWTILEDAGAVFLPAAGWRTENLVLPGYGFKGGTDFRWLCGYYWLASYSSNISATGVLFLEGGLHKSNGTAPFDRSAGLSVRLVYSTQNSNNNYMEVTTHNVTDITQTTAVCGGSVTVTGNGTVTARGVCWSTSPNPTMNDNLTNNGTGTGSFTSNITGLTPNTTYYVRAFATNNASTVYGEQKTFTTASQSIPSVVTSNVTNITQTTAVCGGNVTSDGGSAVTTRGVCWSTSPNPTINDNHTNNGTGIGSFTCSITELTPNTTYFVRAYAQHNTEYIYGDTKSFTTLKVGGNGSIPEGAIRSQFSVSPSQQVYFSQGNLQYQASTNTWRFAENQWDVVGEGNKNISATYNGWIDLFGWGTSGWDCGNTYYHPWDFDNSCDDCYGPPCQNNLTGSYAHSDWGIHNAISNGGNDAGLWRTLTQEEFNYLLEVRSTPSGIRCAFAIVNNVRGIILLPDDWNESFYNLNNTNSVCDEDNNIISLSSWNNYLQANGAVFLPCSGHRSGTTIYEINIEYDGSYWLSTCEENHGNQLAICFSWSDCRSFYGKRRYYGSSVRLVCPAN